MSKTILVTNDDGISAGGIRALIEIAQSLGEVMVVAPDKPQSGMGHAITVNATLHMMPVDIEGVKTAIACSGTPVDCVKYAVSHLLNKKPDLVLSGINHGVNSSINVIYSGTMSAAVEGAISGIPSIGFSLSDFSPYADFTPYSSSIEGICRQVLKSGMRKGICLNVNFPRPKLGKMKGMKVCRQAEASWVEKFEERKDPHGRTYYWLSGEFVKQQEVEGTDEWALANNYGSIVPVKYDLTAYNALDELKPLEDVV